MAQWGVPTAFSSPDRTRPVPSACLRRGGIPSPLISLWPSSWPFPTSPTTSFLYWDAPDLNTVLPLESYESRAERDNHLPVPAGPPSSDEAQDTIGFLSYKSTLLNHLQFFIYQDPLFLLSRANLKDLFSHSVYIPGITLTQV